MACARTRSRRTGCRRARGRRPSRRSGSDRRATPSGSSSSRWIDPCSCRASGSGSPSACRSGRPTSPTRSESPVKTSHGSSSRGDGRRRRRRDGRARGPASRARERPCSRARRPRRQRAGRARTRRPHRPAGRRPRPLPRRAPAGRRVVCLHMRLEDGHDRRADPLGLGQICVNELGMSVDDGERCVRAAAEQEARTRGSARRGTDAGSSARSVWRRDTMGKTNVPMGAIAMADTPLAPLGRDTAASARRDRSSGQRLGGGRADRDRPADRQRAPASPRDGGRAASRRAKRPRQPPHRGRRVLALHAGQALATLRAGEEELAALAGLEAGTIHIGASTTPGVYLLPDTLGCFRRDHPNVTVEVEIASTGEMIERLLAGRVQLALIGETDADERLVLEPFLSDEIVGVARPGVLPLRDGRVEAKHSPTKPCSFAKRARAHDVSATERSQRRRRAGRDLGARLERGDQARRAGRPRRRLPLPLRRRRGDRTRRTRALPTRQAIQRRLHVAYLARRSLSPASGDSSQR